MLSIRNLSASYGEIQALDDVSLDLNAGEIVALLGSNGAGKSTILKAVVGLVRPTAGKAEFLGKPVFGRKTEDIVKMGIVLVPEGRRIFPELTVQENLIMGSLTRKDKKAVGGDIDRVYTLFPVLKSRLKQMGGTLSGGEQQMLAIGRGLMAKPKLLMLDEPSLGLAPLLIESIFQTLVDIRAMGTPILLVEQNANVALTIADRGYVLETGSCVLHDTAGNLLSNEQVKKIYLGG